MTLLTSIKAGPGDRARRYFVGGSDARIIMGTDEVALARLWREKRGEAEPPDYSDNLLVQLGVATEPLNRRWFEKTTGQAVRDVQTWIRHPVIRWMAATLDGIVEGPGAVYEAKFMLPWSFSEETAAEKHTGPAEMRSWPNYLLRCWQNYRRLFFKFNASSRSRRSASEREGLSGCFSAHLSTLSLSAGESLIGIVSP
jgi:YqaJ-like viral recombinase domain